MGRFLLIAAALLVVILIGGTVFLMVWNIPAPTARVEKVIPDARFPR
jgi:small neutral amino acid transporter SnatA (MarC family)